MRPTDFRVNDAAAKLDALLQRFKDQPLQFQPHSRRCQAECQRSLWSQIDAVIDRQRTGDETVYLMRWKACWTPQSKIDDDQWVAESLEANKNKNCRRSMRQSGAGGVTRLDNQTIMLLADVEGYLSEDD
jgi:hypothetical protein